MGVQLRAGLVWGAVLLLLTGCHVVVRKDAKDLTAAEKAEFVAAVHALKTMPSPYEPDISYYDQFVRWHLEINDCLQYAYHGGPAFLPWHRAFLLEFEKALEAAAGKPIAIPYWDWTNPESTDAVFSPDFMGGTGDPNQHYAVITGPFRIGEWDVSVFDPDDPDQFPFITRNIGSPMASTLPTRAQVETALSIPNYDVSPWSALVDETQSFRQYLEGWRGIEMVGCTSVGEMLMESAGTSQMHNRVHLWVGGGWEDGEGGFHTGTMTFMSSPADPVFWLHHAYVDYLWEQWMEVHGRVYEPTLNGREHHNTVDVLWPFTEAITGRDWRPFELRDSLKLGVYYMPPAETSARK